MKTNYILLLLGVVISSLSLVGCGKDDEADIKGIDYERVYMQQGGSVVNSNVLKTPLGYFGTLNAKMEITTTAPLSTSTTAHVTIDPSLTASYNDAHGTEYQPIPDGVVKLDKTSLTVSPGATVSDTLTLSTNEAGLVNLEKGKSYLVPVTIQDAGGSDAHLARDLKYRTRYFVLNYNETQSILISNPTKKDLQGEAVSTDEEKNWKCISATDLTPEEYANLFSGDWGSGWNFLNGKDVLTADFTLDFGSVHNISAFYVECYLTKSIKMEISSDDNTWSEIANTADGNPQTVWDDDWKSWYVLYAPVSARYVKMTLTLDPNSWAWSWYKYISGIQFMFKD